MESIASSPAPQRHRFLTAWLVLTIGSNGLTAISLVGLVLTPLGTGVFSPLSLLVITPFGDRITGASIACVVMCCCAHVVFAVALLRRRKWGAYGFLATIIFASAGNFVGIPGMGLSLPGLLVIVVLFVLLHIGGPKRAWLQLG